MFRRTFKVFSKWPPYQLRVAHHVQLDGAAGFVQRRGVANLRQDRPPADLVPQALSIADTS